MSECHDSECRCHRFHDKVALVTGAASGIGQACAVDFAREQAKVAICDVNEEGLEETRQQIEALGGECLVQKVDIRRREEVEAFIAAVLERFGTLDILVNNAGTGQFVPFAFVEDEEYDRVMDINVRGMFYFCRAALPTMMDNDYGKIVNITSIMSVVAGQGQSIYNASKGAAKMLTQGIAVDVSGYNINVNAVGPGMVLTGLTQNMLGDPEQAEWFIERIPKRRIAEPQDIANAVLFLSSDEADYIHGTTLFVDGGMICTRG
ncbi:MAG: SDR family oxidoreductase [Anaerolineae bacterium]|nr:SDR family oxidoreductase [Anaerolineae bacterium]